MRVRKSLSDAYYTARHEDAEKREMVDYLLEVCKFVAHGLCKPTITTPNGEVILIMSKIGWRPLVSVQLLIIRESETAFEKKNT